MAWTAPVNTFASGNVLTAAQMNAIGDNLWAGGPVYDTLASLQTAIPSPFEGQRAYLTNPAATTVTASGGTTYIPTGMTVVYNGSAWVSITPVSALTTNNGTTTSTTFTATLGGTPGTNPSVTLITGTTAMVTVSASLANDTTGQGAYMGVAVTGVGGTPTPNQCLYNGGTGGQYIQGSNVAIISGLTAGANVFTLQYKCGGSGTSTFGSRQLTVVGIA